MQRLQHACVSTLAGDVAERMLHTRDDEGQTKVCSVQEGRVLPYGAAMSWWRVALTTLRHCMLCRKPTP